MGKRYFVPLESNPEVLTDFAQSLGADVTAYRYTDVWGLDETIGNACGTIGVLHSILNNADNIAFADDSFLSQFQTATVGLTPEARGEFLENPPSADVDIASSHAAAAAAGSTVAPDATSNVDLHFVTFVVHGGRLYELDGSRVGPIDHGAASRDTLLADVVATVRRVYLSSSDSLNFSLIALASAGGA